MLTLKSGLKPIVSIPILGVLLIALFSYSIISINHSEKCLTAKKYLERNSDFLEATGEIVDYGYFVSHSIAKDEQSSYIGLKAKGRNTTVRVRVYFVKDSTDSWKVERYEIQ
jgi:hypothetical protein